MDSSSSSSSTSSGASSLTCSTSSSISSSIKTIFCSLSFVSISFLISSKESKSSVISSEFLFCRVCFNIPITC
ncbi:hypothetical protein C0J27_04425 [Candidatus Chromulinivorax destructor]|uniref:Uncharacterized protein n=1 Tax=Candidatus Chromulinivorax destructor TaxID=2066483 RepID=A0A345ZCD6_9BACT|nr:hypothetical protein C0J27_04425 [Candidatus Chromulinivorax destructor]